MRTPKDYQEYLKRRIITSSMLEDCLYSVNKRAKNWRDKKREYKQLRYDKYHNYENAEAKESEMYSKKHILLSLLAPIRIHQEFAGFERTRVYDYQKNYRKTLFEKAKDGTVVWVNSFVRRKRGCKNDDYYDFDDDFDYDYYDNYEEVYFFDYIDLDKPLFNFYLYYKLGEHSFHTPITKQEAEKYLEKNENLEVKMIPTLKTTGNEIKDMISVQFVDKVIELINSKNYIYIPGYIEEEEEQDEEENITYQVAPELCEDILMGFASDFASIGMTRASKIIKNKALNSELSKEYEENLKQRIITLYDEKIEEVMSRKYKHPIKATKLQRKRRNIVKTYIKETITKEQGLKYSIKVDYKKFNEFAINEVSTKNYDDISASIENFAIEYAENFQDENLGKIAKKDYLDKNLAKIMKEHDNTLFIV